jgi:4-amino-4-deoxy-L-arabinose transferase-like glycosyltransferase
VIVCPLLFVLASHGLTETLATFLLTLELYLVLQALRGRRQLLFTALAGAVAGSAQLVRADALTLAPAALGGLWFAADRAWRRLPLFVGYLGVAALVFLPWPVRNLIEFGRAYPAAVQFRSAAGKPLPNGVITWARTFASSAPREPMLDAILAFEQPWHPGALLFPSMYDSDAEKQQLLTLIEQYNRERLSPAVDAGFSALARQRAARAPFRTYVKLPLQRMLAMFASVPNGELSMKSSILNLPKNRPLARYFDLTLYGLALLGMASLLSSLGRRKPMPKPGERAAISPRLVAAILMSAIVTRCLVLAYTVPLGCSQRYLVEVFPLFIVLAALGAAAPAASLFSAISKKNR